MFLYILVGVLQSYIYFVTSAPAKCPPIESLASKPGALEDESFIIPGTSLDLKCSSMVMDGPSLNRNTLDDAIKELPEELRQENKMMNLDIAHLADSDTQKSATIIHTNKSGFFSGPMMSALTFVTSPNDDTINKLTEQLKLLDKQRRSGGGSETETATGPGTAIVSATAAPGGSATATASAAVGATARSTAVAAAGAKATATATAAAGATVTTQATAGAGLSATATATAAAGARATATATALASANAQETATVTTTAAGTATSTAVATKTATATATAS